MIIKNVLIATALVSCLFILPSCSQHKDSPRYEGYRGYDSYSHSQQHKYKNYGSNDYYESSSAKWHAQKISIKVVDSYNNMRLGGVTCTFTDEHNRNYRTTSNPGAVTVNNDGGVMKIDCNKDNYIVSSISISNSTFQPIKHLEKTFITRHYETVPNREGRYSDYYVVIMKRK